MPESETPPVGTSREVEALKKEIAQLTFLVEASKLLNSSLELEPLLEIIVDLAIKGTGSQRGTLYILEAAKGELWSKVAQGPEKVEIRLPVGSGIAGKVAETGEVIRIEDAYQDSRFNPEVDRNSGFRTHGILTVPMHNKQGAIIGVLQVLNKSAGNFTDEDVSFLEVLQTHAAIAIENALLFKEALEKKRIDRELDLAADIQRNLLPSNPPRVAGLELAALSEPCRQVGGDYFDFVVRDEDRFGICVADISGKGIPASLLMATPAGQPPGAGREPDLGAGGGQEGQRGDLPLLQAQSVRVVFLRRGRPGETAAHVRQCRPSPAPAPQGHR